LAALMTASTAARAETPSLIPVQGYLLNGVVGEPVEGEHPVRFRLYPAAVGGDPLWEETQPVEFVAGWFVASLGAATPLPAALFDRATPLYLGVRIGDDDEELSPRPALGGTPYALHAATAGAVSDLDGLVEALTAHEGFQAALPGPPGMVPGQVANCMLQCTADACDVVGDDGEALSEDNVCTMGARFVVTEGEEHRDGVGPEQLTSPLRFTTEDLAGSLFGIADADWPEAMPLFLGLVGPLPGRTLTLSRLPLTRTELQHDRLCARASGECDDVLDVLYFSGGPPSWHAAHPITQVGWVAVTYSQTDGWSFSHLYDPWTTGFNRAYETKWFEMPRGQNGAAEGRHFMAVQGGTPPGPWATGNLYHYTLYASGMCEVFFNFYGGNPHGQGDTPLRLALPVQSVVMMMFGTGYYRHAGEFHPLHVGVRNGDVFAGLRQADGGLRDLRTGDLSQETDEINGTLRYRVFQ